MNPAKTSPCRQESKALATTQIINLTNAVGVLSTDFVPIQRTGETASKATLAEVVALASVGIPSATTLTTNQGIQGGGLLASGLTISLNVSSITTATEMAAADSFPINKVSDGNLTRLVTFPNAMKALTGLPILSFPDATDDYMIINRASDGSSYKINTSALSLVTANMPAGGLTGQILTKASDDNYDTTWTTGGFLDQVANTVFSGPSSGGDAAPAFRALVGADLPNPGASSKGGVQSYAAVSNQFLTQISTSGVVTSAQPSAANLSNGVTGSGAVVLATSPALTTPNLGTPSAVTLTNGTGLPVSTGISGLGTGIATFLATPSSANLAAAVTDETGSGLLVFATSPALTTPDLGTPSAAVLTNATGLPLSTGVTGTLPVANGGTGITAFGTGVAAALGENVTGSGGIALATSPTFVTPVLGTPTTGTLTNCTGLPISSGVSGLGSGVATFLATPSSANLAAVITNETGSGSLVFATSPTLVTPLLGTPTSGTLTNCTGLPLTTGVTGTLPVASGGTGANAFTTNGILYGNNTSAVQVTAAGTSGQVLGANTAAPPTFQSLSAVFDNGLGNTQGMVLYRGSAAWTALPVGTSGQVLTTNGAAADPTWETVTGTGTVTSVAVSGGTTGLTVTGSPITTAGTITLEGTLITSNGGTGLASYTQGDLLYYNSSTALSKLAKDTNATRYLSNTGASNNPAWAQVALATGVSGQLHLANGGTAANLSDPGADRIMFWDESANAVTWLAPNAGIEIATTNINTMQAINAQTGTTYTVVNGDQAKLVTISNAASVAVTLPQAGAGSEFLTNWYADFQNITGPLVTITPTTSTIDGATSLALGRNQGVRIVSNGTNYFTQRGGSGCREKLTAARTYYVRTDGSNSNNGLANTSGGAWLTLQYAVDWITQNIDCGGNTVTLQVGAGTFAGFSVFSSVVGSAAQTLSGLVLLGDTTTPTNCVINSTITCTGNNAVVRIAGFSFTAAGGDCLYASGGGWISVYGNVNFASAANYHMHTNVCGVIVVAATSYTITAGASIHYYAEKCGVIEVNSTGVTITGTPAFSLAYATASMGYLKHSGCTFTGSATGKRYISQLNGVVDSGSGGANYFPGNVAGTTATGGQYV
jgi:hypothetical protein